MSITTKTFPEIKVDDYGHKLHFYLTKADGTAYDLTAKTPIFECYKDAASSLTINDSAHVTTVSPATDGHVYYTTQSTDFDDEADAGTWWTRIRVDHIASAEVKLPVVSAFPDGEEG